MPALIKGVDYSNPAIRYRGERIVSLFKKLVSDEGPSLKELEDIDFAISVFYTFFFPFPMIREDATRLSESDEVLRKQLMILAQLMKSDKFEEIRRKTIADTITSMVVSALFMEAIARELRKQIGPQGGDFSGQKGGSSNITQQLLKRVVSKALDSIKEQASQAKEITTLVQRFSAGTGSMLSLEDSILDIINLAKNTDVKTILEVLKTIEDVEGYIKKRKLRSPRGELDGYETGNDVERIVISELALPKEIFLTKFVENSLLLYKKVIPESRGPFYVLLDKSGSMMGTKVIWAKAVAIALAQRAVRERRDFYVRFFDSIPYPPLFISKKLRGRDVVKLIEYIARIRANGGTDITRAILTATEDIIVSKNKHLADIVLITDGEDRVTIDAVRRGLSRARARLHTVMIHGNNPDLRQVSDTYMSVTKLSKEEALQVIRI
ncbi:MAG: VWA domain-containing protein [Pyrodictiaceae archaeon]